VIIEGQKAADCIVIDAGSSAIAWHDGRQTVVVPDDAIVIDVDHMDAGGIITSPMHGKVLTIDVKTGDSVGKGQRVAVIEAMKMEHALTAPMDGIIAEIVVSVGEQVAERARVLVIEPLSEKGQDKK